MTRKGPFLGGSFQRSWRALNGTIRTQRTSTLRHSSSAAAAQTADTINPRWLSDTKSRIGKCITFGMTSQQTAEASSILSHLSTQWRRLLCGSEGFLSSPSRTGLYKQSVVWGEMDVMGHVNNVTYVRYCESGRCAWFRNFGQRFDQEHKQGWEEMASSRGTGLILRSITVDYKFPMEWPDRISVMHKLRVRPDEKTDSILLDVLILSERSQRPAARAFEDIVVYDYGARRKTALPSFVLKQFQETYDLQEEEKLQRREELGEMLERVTALEKATWHRPDAKEDLGTISP